MSGVPERNSEKRRHIANAIGVTPPSGAFRKDHLNVLLFFLDGPAVMAREVYGPESNEKEWFYEHVADAAGFDYEPGDGANARPFRSDELDDLIAAVDAVIKNGEDAY